MNETMRLNPFIRYAGFFHNFYYKNETHQAYDCRLFYILQGEIFLTVDGKRHTLSEGDAIFLPPAKAYGLNVDEGSRNVSLIVFNFDCECSDDNPPYPLHTPLLEQFLPEKVLRYAVFPPLDEPVVCHSISEIRHDCESAVEIFLRKGTFFREESGILLKRVLLRLLQQQEYRWDPRRKLLDEVKAFIFENACDGIRNEDIATRFGYHSYYLNRLLQNREGVSLNKLMVARKLQRAEELIITTDKSITDIAMETGFSGVPYFSRLFKENYGMGPLQFRRKFKTL